MVHKSQRGQSSVLALVLVMALALATAIAVATVGSVTLLNSQQYAETEKAVSALAELDSKASFVALGGGDGATMDLGLNGREEQVSVRDAGRLRIVLVGDTSTVLANTTLGTVAYRNGNQRIAYQGGGVWRRDVTGNGSAMVSPPEVHYRRGTLTLPMVKVVGEDGSLSVAELREGDRTPVYPRPDEGEDWQNPVESGSTLVLYVTSDYYQGWASYFERRLGASTTTYHHNRTVRVTLVAPGGRYRLDSGLISVGTGSPIDMRGNAGQPTFIDSYDSDSGPYAQSHGGEGTVRSSSGLNLGGNSYIKGDVNTSGVVDFDGNNNTIYGHASHGGLGHNWNKSGTITDWEAENGTGVDVPPIDGAVNGKVGATCDGSNTLTVSGDTTVSASGGPYCVDGDLTLSDEVLTIDLSEGNVSIAVDGDVTVGPDGSIEVTNPGNATAARVWLAGETVTVNGGDVTVAEDKSPAFRLYAGSGTTVNMRSQASFTGVAYAPTTQEAGGGLSMQSQSDLYGSAVVGEVSMKSGSAVHYDRALDGFRFEGDSTAASRLSYLFVTINEVEVEER